MTEKLKKSDEIGRNVPCWCGSGKKYKKCHLNREKEQGVAISDISRNITKAFSKKMCLHPAANRSECKGGIVRAHTVQRASLSRIAEDGHTYAFIGDASAFRGDIDKMRVLKIRKIGITDASVFTGFCAKHDNDTFKVIENENFRCCPEHVFLLGYRALCRELFDKKATLSMKDTYRAMDGGQPIECQVQIQRFMNAFLAGTKAGHDEMQRIKTIYDKVLENRVFSQVRYYVILFQECPDIMCSGGFWPQYDFAGRKIQDILNSNVEGMQFSLIATEKGGVAVFTWIENKGISENFIKSLDTIPDMDLPHAITRFVFEYFENTYFRPSWWDSLNEDVQRKLHKRMVMIDSISMEHQPNCLIDDGMRVVNWRVITRKTNSSAIKSLTCDK